MEKTETDGRQGTGDLSREVRDQGRPGHHERELSRQDVERLRKRDSEGTGADDDDGRTGSVHDDDSDLVVVERSWLASARKAMEARERRGVPEEVTEEEVDHRAIAEAGFSGQCTERFGRAYAEGKNNKDRPEGTPDVAENYVFRDEQLERFGHF